MYGQVILKRVTSSILILHFSNAFSFFVVHNNRCVFIDYIYNLTIFYENNFVYIYTCVIYNTRRVQTH